MHIESALPTPQPKKPDHEQLYEKAKELEVAFLTEMLAHAGLGDSPDAFGGGIGEEQFSSFLRTEQARGIVEKGGLGLAQNIFESLVKTQEAKHDQ